MNPRAELPTGAVTFLFSDIEGSTRLLAELGRERYGQAMADHPVGVFTTGELFSARVGCQIYQPINQALTWPRSV